MSLYDSAVLDGFAYVLFALFAAVAITLIVRVSKRWRKRRWIGGWRLIFRSTPALAGLTALLLTYSTVRTQTRLAADVALNVNGDNFVNRELDNPLFRCLYKWHAFDQSVKCRKSIISNDNNYGATMLYIEEVIFILKKSNQDRSLWGTSYAQDVGYWASDVAEDPTGMFSYALVVENQGEIAETIQAAALNMSIERVCRNFELVRTELAANDDAKPDTTHTCP